jgi:hypothetical protein
MTTRIKENCQNRYHQGNILDMARRIFIRKKFSGMEMRDLNRFLGQGLQTTDSSLGTTITRA